MGKESKVQKNGVTGVKNSDLTSLRSQIVAAIQTCEKNNSAIQNLKSEVKNGNVPRNNPTGVALSCEELKKLKNTIVKGVFQCDKNAKLITELKKEASKKEENTKTSPSKSKNKKQ